MKIIAEKLIGQKTLRVVQGDLTERDTDAIVNAANEFLQHGGGVAGAIVRRGGQVIQDESNRIGHTPVGTAVITGAGKLKARYVIHTVGPRMGEGDEDFKLKSAVRSVLELATRRGLRSVSMPAVSAGIFGFPKERCAAILVVEAAHYLRAHIESTLAVVEFCLHDDEMAGLFKAALLRIS